MEVFIYAWRKDFAEALMSNNRGFVQLNDVQHWQFEDDRYLRWFISLRKNLEGNKSVTLFLARKYVARAEGGTGFEDKWKQYDSMTK